jgi:hypothetical protein
MKWLRLSRGRAAKFNARPLGMVPTGFTGRTRSRPRSRHSRAPNSEHQSLVPISRDEFFQEFDKKGLALIYEPDSNFNKQVERG